jgi:sensor histidine kinase YesM
MDRLDDAFGGMLYSFMLSSSLSSGLGWLVNYNSTLIPWLKAPFKRLILEIVTVFIYSFAASFVVIFSFHWFFGHFKMEQIPWDFLLMNTQYPVYVAYGITFFFTSRSFLQEWKEAAVDAEKLRTEQFAGKYRSLKDQLNPHFLFNSLNVLSNIVYEDQDKAVDFIQHLSRFYRYVLEVQKEEIVSLEREMDFGRRYLLLQQLRFGENLKVKLDVDPKEGEFLPPLSLQLLLENALKHNEVSNENPLQLTIVKEGSKIIIENQINPKAQVDESTGVGLTNIKERYRLLSKEEVVIKNDGKTFRVELPLLNLEN